ncbi:MAG: 2-hydroxychromene-2-carboxylate isomerase, partial [Solirubrobacteraceae bacterium]
GLGRARAVLGIEPRLQPILLGAIFARRGFGSWSATPVRELRIAELEARATRYGRPGFCWPQGWPADGLKAMRCATWAQRQGALRAFAGAVFESEFVHGADISDEEVLAASARRAGLDPEQMRRASDDPQVKQALREATEEAWDRGVRGVPSIGVGDALFFGDDQLELAAAALAAA